MSDIATIKQQVQKTIDALAPGLKEISLSLHANPELAFEERESAKMLTDFLKQNGFQVEEGIAGLPTAFKAERRGARSRPNVTFLAEYDALPQTGHACGHNLIAAGSLGAAVGLAQACPDLPGKVSLTGTPAEEKGGGKIILAKAGIFDDVDAAMMVHPDCKTELVKRTLAMTSLRVSFKGKAAHAAASPHQGINALDAVILGFNAIGALRQQIKPDARIHGIITDGGQAPNIIPEHAAAAFFIRALDLDYLEELLARVKNCLSGAAQATGTAVVIEVDELVYAPFKPNYHLSDLYHHNLQALGVKADKCPETEGIASTDVGNVSQVVPTIHPSLEICGLEVAVHSPRFAEAAASEFAQERMLIAAKALAMTALDLFYTPEALKKVKKEF